MMDKETKTYFKGSRKKSPKYDHWYGWRKDKNSEKYKEWRDKISKTLSQVRLEKGRQKRLKKQKTYTYEIQRPINKN